MERIEDGAAFDQRRLLHKPPCSNLDSIQHHGRKGLLRGNASPMAISETRKTKAQSSIGGSRRERMTADEKAVCQLFKLNTTFVTVGTIVCDNCHDSP